MSLRWRRKFSEVYICTCRFVFCRVSPSIVGVYVMIGKLICYVGNHSSFSLLKHPNFLRCSFAEATVFVANWSLFDTSLKTLAVPNQSFRSHQAKNIFLRKSEIRCGKWSFQSWVFPSYWYIKYIIGFHGMGNHHSQLKTDYKYIVNWHKQQRLPS